jgi:hypothetical protein
MKFVKENFFFDEDPYEAWYVIDGDRRSTHYNQVTEYRELRNALVHEGGDISDNVTDEFPNVPTRNGSIVMNQDYYKEAKLALKSIAFHLAKMIDQGKYSPKGGVT